MRNYYFLSSNRRISILCISILLFNASLITVNAQPFKPEEVKIVNPGPPINSPAKDYCPILTSNGKFLFFSSDRKGSIIYNKRKHCSHDIYYAVINTNNRNFEFTVKNIDPQGPGHKGVNSPFNETVGFINHDLDKMYFIFCDRPDCIGSCDIFSADVNIQGSIIEIGKFQHLSYGVNCRFMATKPYITPDNKTLYFISASNRDTDQMITSVHDENYDIYYSQYDEKEKIWLKAKRLPDIINSKGNEMSPVILPDEKTLIFASDGLKPNYGGYDIYISRMDDNGNWSKPINLGDKINSSEDEIGFYPNPDCSSAYFSSKRDDFNSEDSIPGFVNHDNQGDLDIYYAEFPCLIKDFRKIRVIAKFISEVVVMIYDDNNKLVRTYKMGYVKAGDSSFLWDGKDDKGNECKPGIYKYIVSYDSEPGIPSYLFLNISEKGGE